MAEYRVKQPGDVLELRESLDTADIGLYVLVNIRAGDVLLSRLGVDPETDMLVVTDMEVRVSLPDLSLFQSTGLSIENVPAPKCAVALGDIMEPIKSGDPVPIGLYEVVEIEGDDIRLSRLHSNEDGKLATTQRLSWIARSQLGSFRTLRIEDNLLP